MMRNDAALLREVLDNILEAIGYLEAAGIKIPTSLHKAVDALRSSLGLKTDLPTTRGMGQS
jgi:hypothetical protein